MLVKEKISAPQMCFMMIPVIIATEFLGVPGVVYQSAKQDAWMSIILSSFTGAWAIIVFCWLASRHPGMTIVEYAEKILGKWLGKLIALIYAYYLFILVATIGDEIMSFITLFAQPETPRLATLTVFFLLCGVGAWLGIEVLARCSEFLVPLNIFFVLLVSVLLLPDMQPENLKPVLGGGVLPVLKGAIVPSGWMGEFFLLGFILPCLNNSKHSKQFAFGALLAMGVIMVLITIEAIMVDGQLTGKLTYAYYAAARYVSIASFLERIDPVILGVWVYGGFLKNAVYVWALCLCTGQLFGLKNYRPIVVPLTILSIVGCFWVFIDAPDLNTFLKYTFPLSGIVLHNLLPTMLLCVDLVRSRRRQTA